LHCLRGTPGIMPFLGVVIDDQYHTINAVLSELPAKGDLLNIVKNGVKCGQPVAWERRERWCKQILQAVAEIHSKGFAIGTMSRVPSCGIGVGVNDDAAFHNFLAICQYRIEHMAMVPPEHRGWLLKGRQIRASAETDLYDLGFLLWRIANNSYRWKISTAAYIENHDAMIEFLATDEHTPQHVREVITTCCDANPGKRLPAWQLLKRLSSEMEAGTGLTKRSNSGKRSLQ